MSVRRAGTRGRRHGGGERLVKRHEEQPGDQDRASRGQQAQQQRRPSREPQVVRRKHARAKGCQLMRSL